MQHAYLSPLRCHVGRWALRGISMILLLALVACSTLPDKLPRLAQTYATPPQTGGILAELEAKIINRHGAGVSGFETLDSNEAALKWRLALVDSAQHSIDLQYYLWYQHDSGTLLMQRLLHAAERGVRVRLLLDDVHTSGRDSEFAALHAHPNIQVRLFNPFRGRELLGRGFDFAQRAERLHQRMHNKLMVADNRAVIVGGRNIGDEYFGFSDSFNFRDLDLLAIGPVARQSSAAFDRFWNSNWVVAASALPIDEEAPDIESLLAPMMDRLRSAPISAHFFLQPQDWRDAFATLLNHLHPGTTRLLSDTPTGDVMRHRMPQAIRRLITTARNELLILNAYIIPDQETVDTFRALTQRGVRVKIITNSLASQDVTAVNSHYKFWRRPLLEAGVELYEVRPDAAIRAGIVNTTKANPGLMGLHAKAIIVDGIRVFVGSTNLDPRSVSLNSEMGIVVESPSLARELVAIFTRDAAAENAWQVVLDDERQLVWRAGDDIRTIQPARDLWQRVQDFVFIMVPVELY